MTVEQAKCAEEEWSLGPDALMPADSLTISDIRRPVKLRLGETDAKQYPPISIYTIFKRVADQRPDADALAYKSDPKGPWIKLTYSEYWKICNKAAKSFIQVSFFSFF